MVNCDRLIIPAPVITNSYRTDAILNALGVVFFNKCYICEKKHHAPNLFEVDHFIPQGIDSSLTYVWSNLYLCCRECNSSRKRKIPEGGYMDSCSQEDNVEQEIIYTLPPYDFTNPIFSPQANKRQVYPKDKSS